MKDEHFVEHIHLPNQIHGILGYTAKVKGSRDMLDRIAFFSNKVVSE